MSGPKKAEPIRAAARPSPRRAAACDPAARWRARLRWLAAGLFAGQLGCATSLPGTHVELVSDAGSTLYVAGAAASGMQQALACAAATQRAQAALAQRFADEQRPLADELRTATGTGEPAALLVGYARATLGDAAPRDVSFDPETPICLASVRWRPQPFLRDAVMQYALAVKAAAVAPRATVDDSQGRAPPPPGPADVDPAARREAGPQRPAAPGGAYAPPSAGAPGASSHPPPNAGPTAFPAPPTSGPTSSGAPPVSPPPAPPPAACDGARRRFNRAAQAQGGPIADWQECLRRTQNDTNVCHGYRLRLEQAQKQSSVAGQALAECLNRDLPPKIRLGLSSLAGHAVVVVESRGDGSATLWTYAPADATALAVETAPDGHERARRPLDAQQLAWTRQQLGL